MPTQFPAWTETLGAMIDGGCKVRVICTKCRGHRDVDLGALAEKVGRDYSLINRRSHCRMTPGCTGWNRFYYLQATYRPLWTHERSIGWMLE